jgi:hypothetical protein
MNIPRRSLYATVTMLESSETAAHARYVAGRIHVWLDIPGSVAPWVAIFEKMEAARAANWLAASVVHMYPKSDLAKVWRVIAEAAAAAERSSE